jgi:hypothetical protein
VDATDNLDARSASRVASGRSDSTAGRRADVPQSDIAQQVRDPSTFGSNDHLPGAIVGGRLGSDTRHHDATAAAARRLADAPDFQRQVNAR